MIYFDGISCEYDGRQAINCISSVLSIKNCNKKKKREKMFFSLSHWKCTVTMTRSNITLLLLLFLSFMSFLLVSFDVQRVKINPHSMYRMMPDTKTKGAHSCLKRQFNGFFLNNFLPKFSYQMPKLTWGSIKSIIFLIFEHSK